MAYGKIAASAQKAITRRASLADNSKSSETEKASSPSGFVSSGAVHTSLSDQFRTAALTKYGSIEEAWDSFDSLSQPKGQVSRADFKSICKTVGLHITSKEKGKLRKSIDKSNSKIISLQDFEAFMLSSIDPIAQKTDQTVGKIANVPFDAPSLPENYRARPEVENKLIDLLVGSTVCKGSVVCAFGR